MSTFPIVDGVTVAIPPPEGYAVNFDHPLQRHAIESYVISGIGTALAFLFFSQYLYVKLWVLRKPDGETGKNLAPIRAEFSCAKNKQPAL
jgi:hypothetical protein